MNTVLLKCFVCSKQYNFPLKSYNLKKKRSPLAKDFCSHDCHNQSRKKYNFIFCDNCGVSFSKDPVQIRKTKNNFCSRNCGASYKNKHKTSGFRRSKLEIFLEDKILENFDYLKCNFNVTSIIGSELDIYFPDLKLAIQINGIVHYKPIYGLDKLNKILVMDNEKRRVCLEKSIKLVEIDVSKDTDFKSTKNNRWLEINTIIIKNLVADAGFEPNATSWV